MKETYNVIQFYAKKYILEPIGWYISLYSIGKREAFYRGESALFILKPN